MENVKVYDLNKWMIDSSGYQVYSLRKIMIIEGSKGVVIRDYEGCGYDKNLISDSFPVQLNDYNPKTDNRVIYIVPQYQTFMVIEDVVNNADCEEMPLQTFMRKWNYNDRCRSNFRETLNSMTNAGIDVSLYVEE